MLCLGCLATLLTTWVLHLYHTNGDQPVTPLYHVLASRLLAPFQGLTRCNKNKDVSSDENTDQNRFSKAAKVAPLQASPKSALALVPPKNTPTDFGTTSLKMMQLDGNSPERVAGSDVGESGGGGTDPTYTWQEIAAMLDHFFLWLFAVMLVVLTTVILSLLYAKY